MNKLRCFIRNKSKAIAAGAGTLAAYVALHVFGVELDATASGLILVAVPVLITYIAPKNIVCPK